MIDGKDGMRNVQNGFIFIEETIRHHRLNTRESEVIKWIADDLGPDEVKTTVKNFLLKNSKKAKRAGRKLLSFHKKLRKLVKKFEEACALGIRTKESGGKTSGGRNNNRREDKSSGRRDNRSNNNSQDSADKPKSTAQKTKERKERARKLKIKYVKCGGNHYPTDCTASQEEVEKFQSSVAGKALSEKLKKEKGNNASNPKGGRNRQNTDGNKSNPRGSGNSSNPRGSGNSSNRPRG